MRSTPLITLLTLAILTGLVACDSSNPTLSRILNAPEHGVGLTRSSFGPLHPEVIPKGYSICNANIGAGLDLLLQEGIGALIDPLRNLMGKSDETINKEELNRYFGLRNTSEPLVRIIDRTDTSIDFWFLDDAVREAWRVAPAAKEYCEGRGAKSAVYVGFAFQCGKETAVPLRINGSQPTVKAEQLIVAYDCVATDASSPQ